LISALIKGQNYLANSLVADATGFQFVMKDKSGKQLDMGDFEKYKEGLQAHICLPKKAMIKLLKDGQYVKMINKAKSLDFPISSPGVYRVEIYRKSRRMMRAWIFSNPIYIE
jgi:hypothetical protein